MNQYCKGAMAIQKLMEEKKKENVNHPKHYIVKGIEPIEYIESHDFNFNLGNVIKYVSRADYKGSEIEDLKKAKWYLEKEIETRIKREIENERERS
jgi:hypothetical protein